MKAKVFISYARADGASAAAQLRAQLMRAGYTVWRDIEDMQGGLEWVEQLRAALREVDAVIVLLTPSSAASKWVGREWDNALALRKRVIPLLIQDCDIPDELRRLQYHTMATPEDYILGFAALVRDLESIRPSSAALASENDQSAGQPPLATPTPNADSYIIYAADRTAIGRNAMAINYGNDSSDATIDVLRHLMSNLEQLGSDSSLELGTVHASLSQIYASVAREHAAELTRILDQLSSNAADNDQMIATLQRMEEVLTNLKMRGDLRPDLNNVVQDVQRTIQSNISLQQKLELSIPIIPFLLDYKAEVLLGSQDTARELWGNIKNWWTELTSRPPR